MLVTSGISIRGSMSAHYEFGFRMMVLVYLTVVIDLVYGSGLRGLTVK